MKKNGMICQSSRRVESPGIEPGSKQATKRLSTRLFPD